MSESSNRRPPGAAASPARSRRARPPISTRAHTIIRSPRDYWVMFRERWHYGLAAAVLVGGGLVALHMNQSPVYSATATLLFENPSKILDLPTVGYGYGEINLATHIEQMKSASFHNYALAGFTPQEIDKIRAAYLDPTLSPQEQPSAGKLISVEITEQRDTPILLVKALHRDPQAAELIANKFATQYIAFNRDRAATSTNSAVLTLQEEERKLRMQLEEAQGKLQEYRELHKTGSLIDNQNVVVARLTSISQQLFDAEKERRDLETTLRQVDEYEKNGRPLIELMYVSSFRSVPNLLRDIDQLRSERRLLEERYGENHPQMIANAEGLAAKEALLKENVATAVAELRSSYAKAVQHEEQVRALQKSAEQEGMNLQQIADGYSLLQKQVAGTSSLYDDVLKRLKETVLQTQLDTINIRILDRASIPMLPTEPDLKKALFYASLIGLFLLVGIPLGLGMLDVRLKAAWEIEQFLEQNLLGEIPAIAGISRKDRAHIMAKDLDHTASEAFRGLFGQLQLNSTVAYPKLVMVSSTLPGEGKSIIANNLAATFASHGKKTLLVDCDLRRPNLHLFYGKDNACGILRWLNSGSVINGAVEDDPDLGILPVKQNLCLLRAGGEHRRATELFESEPFARLMSTLRQQFEVTIVDTPPLGVFPDAMLVSRMCDELIYVCRFNTVNRSKVQRTLDRLKQTNAVLSGIVLNGLPAGKQSAYYDYYGYGSNENKRYKAYYAQKR